MKKQLIVGLTALTALSVLPIAAQGQTSQIKETRNLVNEWVQLRTQIAEEQNEWRADKELMQNRIDLLQEEIDRLQSQIDAFETEADEATQNRVELGREEDTLRGALRSVGTQVSDFEAAVHELFPYFPDPLKEQTRRLFDGLPAEDAEPTGTVGNRLALVVGILNEVDKFNSTVTSGSRSMTFGGESLVVDTIYLGTSIAFFADRQGQRAGIGTPSADGWNWQERSELAESISTLIGVTTGDVSPAVFVNVPVTITEPLSE